MSPRCRLSPPFVALLASVLSAPLHAQGVTTDTAGRALVVIGNGPCNGLVVSSIDIDRVRPPFEGTASRWRHVARAVGLHHTVTRLGVIRAFLQLHVGEACTDTRRAESERLLRDQPFLADTRVTTTPDGAGGVKVLVSTVDEMAVLASAEVHGLNVHALSLGNGNVKGEGLSAKGFFERGFAYRSGYGARLIDYVVTGRPYVAVLEGFQHPLGYYANVELGHPFLTDLQRVAWHVGVNGSDEYRGIGRPAGDPLALQVHQQRWDASSITRVFGTHTVGLLGFGTNGLRITPADTGIVVDKTGLLPDTGTTLRNRYAPVRTARVGLIGGIRRVSFSRVRGFDALTATQDVASGAMGGVYAAKGIPAGGEADSFLSGALYAGTATEKTLLATLMELEGRLEQGSNRWDSVIGSGRVAFYAGGAPGPVFMVDNRYSIATRSRLPVQLSMSDMRGGILGYRDAALVGARRDATHAELRVSRESVTHGADLGLAAFGETATVWAGDVPYGRTATRATIGVSILAAYPTHSKRMYRADFGFPLKRSGSGGGTFEVRFSSEDRTGAFWREPDDVHAARTGAVASTLFVTPVE